MIIQISLLNKCTKKISQLGFDCRHSGTYEDPITAKTREYDIRADKRKDNFIFRSAIECKIW